MSATIHQFSPRVEPGAVASHTRIARDVFLGAGGLRVRDLRGRARSRVRIVGRARRRRRYGRSYKPRPTTGSCTRWPSVPRSPTNCSDAPSSSSSTITTSRPCATSTAGIRRRVRRVVGPASTAPRSVRRARARHRGSHFNETDLIDAGFLHTAVVPFFLDPVELTRARGSGGPRSRSRASRGDGRTGCSSAGSTREQGAARPRQGLGDVPVIHRSARPAASGGWWRRQHLRTCRPRATAKRSAWRTPSSSRAR